MGGGGASQRSGQLVVDGKIDPGAKGRHFRSDSGPALLAQGEEMVSAFLALGIRMNRSLNE